MDKTLARGQLLLLALAGLYISFLGLLTIPAFQRYAIFLHAIRWPLFAEFDKPVKYGLPASRTVNIQIETRDNIKLGAWLILPPSESRTENSPFDGPPSEAEISRSLSSRPTVLFFHGNAATRAVPFRVQHCSTYATRFKANVFAVDYRGFGDSGGTPTEEGLILDARGAWDWVINRGAKPEDVLLVGLSLGTGVVSGFGAELAKEDVRPRGILLLAPFRSIDALLTEYKFLGVIPVLQPLQIYPPLKNFVAKFLVTKFNTSEALPNIKAPILIAHAADDIEIPHTQSHSLFENFAEPFLPPLPALPSAQSEIRKFDWTAFRAINEERQLKRSSIVNKQEIPGFATVHRLNRLDNSGEVVFVEASYGGHDKIGLQDSLIDLIDYTFF